MPAKVVMVLSARVTTRIRWLAVSVMLAEGEKCERCWRVLDEVSAESALCGRCATVVAAAVAA